jgi:predicted nucleic acid-binding protein
LILVDSSVWIDYFRGTVTPQTELLDGLLGREPLASGDLILTEVLQGFAAERDFNKTQKMLTALDVVELGGQEIAIQAARNFRTLRALGVTVRQTIDTVIATLCIESGYDLLHSNRDFDPFAKHLGLRVVAGPPLSRKHEPHFRLTVHFHGRSIQQGRLIAISAYRLQRCWHKQRVARQQGCALHASIQTNDHIEAHAAPNPRLQCLGRKNSFTLLHKLGSLRLGANDNRSAARRRRPGLRPSRLPLLKLLELSNQRHRPPQFRFLRAQFPRPSHQRSRQFEHTSISVRNASHFGPGKQVRQCGTRPCQYKHIPAPVQFYARMFPQPLAHLSRSPPCAAARADQPQDVHRIKKPEIRGHLPVRRDLLCHSA